MAFAAALLAVLTAACGGEPGAAPAAEAVGREQFEPKSASGGVVPPAASGARQEPVREVGAPPQDPRFGDPLEVRGLALTVRCPKERYLLGEPVWLVARIENVGKNPQEERALLIDPTFGIANVLVARPGAKQADHWSPPVGRRPGPRQQARITLEPGDFHEARVPLFLDEKGWFLRQPGRYFVAIEFAPRDSERFVSTPTVFEIVAPEGEDDRAAAKILMEREVAGLLLLGGSYEAGKGVQGLEELVYRFPKSGLAPHAHQALGGYYAGEVYDPELKGIRKPDLERALGHFERALGLLDDPLRRYEARVQLSRCYEGLGRKDDARKVLKDAELVEGAYRDLFADDRRK